MGQIPQQATATVATDHALRRAAKIEIDHVKPGIFDNFRRLGQGDGIGAEELGRYGMLILVVGEIALSLRFPHTRQAVGRSELGHDQPATRLLVADRCLHQVPGVTIVLPAKDAGVADEAAEYRVGHPGHRRQHRGRDHRHTADVNRGRHSSCRRHAVFARIVPVLLHGDFLHEPPTQQRPPSPEASLRRPTALTSPREPLWLPRTCRCRTWHTCGGNAPHGLPYRPASACR